MKQGITFDDVLLIPGYSDFKRDEIDLSTRLTKNIMLKIPLVSSPMDTVTESELAVALAKRGGIGIIHRNITNEDQATEVRKVKDHNLLVGSAVGASKGFLNRVELLTNAGVDVIVVDSAHGNADYILDAIKQIKKQFPDVDIIGGNIATADGAKRLIEAGCDGLRVGMGPGAICTTRVVSGMGVPQITAIMDTVSVAKKHDVPVIADGGIKYSGDMVKAFSAGASTVMMGSFFASCQESPGTVVTLTKDQVPSRFKSIVKEDISTYQFKSYRGMGSVGAMRKGAEIKSEDEFHGKSYNSRVLVAEGVEGLVPVKGTVKDVVEQAIGGIRSGMYYVGTKTIHELQETGEFMQITQASLTESHPHDLLVTEAGKSYS